MLQGVHLQSVNLTLDLHKTFEVTYVRLRLTHALTKMVGPECVVV